MNLGYWLRKTPQPVAVLADDKRIEVVRNGRGWKELTNTIRALEPSKVTCVDGQNNVIRTVVLESEASEEDSKDKPSPEMSDLQLFARLLAEAYDKASSKMQPIVDSAMSFVERGGTRLAKAEAENDRLRAHNHKLNLQIAELTALPAPAEDGGIMGALVAGALQGAQSQQPPPVQPQVLKGGRK